MDTIEQIESQRNELARQIASVGEFRPGNLCPHNRGCGNSKCRCARPGGTLHHGWALTRKSGARHDVAVFLQGGGLRCAGDCSEVDDDAIRGQHSGVTSEQGSQRLSGFATSLRVQRFGALLRCVRKKFRHRGGPAAVAPRLLSLSGVWQWLVSQRQSTGDDTTQCVCRHGAIDRTGS